MRIISPPSESCRILPDEIFGTDTYRHDAELYGRSEYWATPREFMARSGDCGDYAIAKYFALRALGFDPDALRIVVLRDRIRGIGHAVLAVYLADDIPILDSLSGLIVSHARYRHYDPQVSMNETTRWAHFGGNRERERQPYRGLYAQKQ